MASLVVQDLIDLRLLGRLSFIQNIEAQNHLGKHTSTTTVQFPYGNWKVTNPAPLFRKNGAIYTPDSYDATYGTLVDSTLDAGDDISLDVVFSYFNNSTLTTFLRLAISHFNLAPPVSYFSLDDTTQGTTAYYPESWTDILVAYAYKLCLETILVDLMTWKAKILWTSPMELANILQSTINGIDAYLLAIGPNIKGRSFLMPRSVSSGKWSTPATVNDATWQQYTTVRSN